MQSLCLQEVNLLRRLVEQGMSISMAAAYLDSCPSIEFSVWCYCGHDQPSSWHRGYAVCVLDNGRDSGVGTAISQSLNRVSGNIKLTNAYGALSTSA